MKYCSNARRISLVMLLISLLMHLHSQEKQVIFH